MDKRFYKRGEGYIMSVQTFVIASENNVRAIYSLNDTYLTARNAETGTLGSTGNIDVGQKYAATTYSVFRMVFSLDTSGLNDTALIKSAYLQFKGYNPNSSEDTILIKNGMPTYPHATPVVGDYDIDNYSGNGGTKKCSEIGAPGSTVILNLNATGLSWINKTGWTKFIIVSQKDNISDPPTANETIVLQGWDSSISANRMRLVVEYYVPSKVPVVGDPTFSNTKATYTKATANISDAGGGYEERGFEYGTSEVATWAVRETGVWGATGNYSMVLDGLLPETTYYARAYATNSYGTDYSDWTSFTTTDVPSYGIYEETNTPTICFYVRRAGGKWSIKHGPYTTDQADIEIGKILTEGKGKYQIKFESDVLTGLSVNIMTKLDIKAR